MKTRLETRQRRQMHTRKRIRGNAMIPRLSVFRSNKHIYAQLIDDDARKTLVTVSDVKATKGTPIEKAKDVGNEVAKVAQKLKLEKVVFDRSGYKFHGRVKSVAEGAREGGLVF